jgi:hypothetical protein
MKKTFLFLAFVLVSLVGFVAQAKVETAPGIQKKIPLEILDVNIHQAANVATISWSTNKPSNGSVLIAEIPVGFDAVGYVDPKFGTLHDVTISGLISGKSYAFQIESRDPYGYSDTSGGTFTAN